MPARTPNVQACYQGGGDELPREIEWPVTPQAAVIVNKKGESRVLRGHPWIFRSDVTRARDVPFGALVKVVGPKGKPLGTALFSGQSEITLRMLARGDEPFADDWLATRLRAAQAWRGRVIDGASAYRVVHGEGDGLPGLVVDRYGEYLVIQTLCQAMERMKTEVVAALVDIFAPLGILERNDPRVRTLEGLPQTVGLLHGQVPATVVVDEAGRRFEADLWKGQKTGLFLDQRENHVMARRYARGRVLDGFCYNGGFALSVASQVDEVLAVDVSDEAVARVLANAALNGLANVRAVSRNVFDLLRELVDAGEHFDTVILDPPAFAKSKDAAEKARRGYKEINLRALKLLSPGGCLITCSCSYHVHEAELEEILASAAADADATVTLVEKRRQGRDHPIVLGVPETYYLKCFVLRKLS
jgi:23S rRNA (cytosine1962-C5)-methyltransferase